jgi:hypothetical protein
MPRSKWNEANETALLDNIEIDMEAGETPVEERVPFLPTHTIGGVPVMRREDTTLPFYTDEQGNLQVSGPNRHAVEIRPFQEYIPPNILPEDKVLFNPEICSAVFRAAAFPMEDAPIGMALTGSGHEARLGEKLPDGTQTVIVNLAGGGTVRVKLPRETLFEKAD